MPPTPKPWTPVPTLFEITRWAPRNPPPPKSVTPLPALNEIELSRAVIPPVPRSAIASAGPSLSAMALSRSSRRASVARTAAPRPSSAAGARPFTMRRRSSRVGARRSSARSIRAASIVAWPRPRLVIVAGPVTSMSPVSPASSPVPPSASGYVRPPASETESGPGRALAAITASRSEQPPTEQPLGTGSPVRVTSNVAAPALAGQSATATPTPISAVQGTRPCPASLPTVPRTPPDRRGCAAVLGGFLPNVGLLGLVWRGLRDQGRAAAGLDRLAGDHALRDVAPRRELELHVEKRLLEDRAKAPGPSLALEGLVGDGGQRVLLEYELDVVELEEALELLGERVPRLGQDRDQVVAAELVDRGHHGEPADELRDQAVLDQVLGQHLLEELARVLVGLRGHVRAEPDPMAADPPLDDVVELREGAAADEEDVGGVDRQELLVRVLSPALRGHGGG